MGESLQAATQNVNLMGQRQHQLDVDTPHQLARQAAASATLALCAIQPQAYQADGIASAPIVAHLPAVSGAGHSTSCAQHEQETACKAAPRSGEPLRIGSGIFSLRNNQTSHYCARMQALIRRHMPFSPDPRSRAPNPKPSSLSCTQAERTKREKARKAATNAGKPLWDEDGQRRGLLDKYDEQEEDASMTVGSSGQLEAKLSRADETRQRLAAGTMRGCGLSMYPAGGRMMSFPILEEACSHKCRSLPHWEVILKAQDPYRCWHGSSGLPGVPTAQAVQSRQARKTACSALLSPSMCTFDVFLG